MNRPAIPSIGKAPGQDGKVAGGLQASGAGWQEAQQLLEQLRRDQQVGLSPDDMKNFNPGRSAPGTEPWKQDFARWDDLKVQVGAALEKLETTAAARLREQQAKDRLNAGASQGVPDAYRGLVDKYYRALAEKGQP